MDGHPMFKDIPSLFSIIVDSSHIFNKIVILKDRQVKFCLRKKNIPVILLDTARLFLLQVRKTLFFQFLTEIIYF